MRKIPLRRVRQAVLAGIGLASLACLGLGWLAGQAPVAAGGAVGLIFLLTRLGARPRLALQGAEPPAAAEPPVVRPPRRAAADPADADALVAQMLAEGRYALLLRSQIASTLAPRHLADAQAALEQSMSLVQEGAVVLGQPDDSPDDSRPAAHRQADRCRVVRVEPLLLDRYPVTNRQFYEFVASGAYGQMPFWDETIWPAVFDFVDCTGQPGPRYWRNACYPAGKEDHPVVGVSWFEAAAYARWTGKRLPTDAEWLKTASWPVALAGGTGISPVFQRRYPWGDCMDRRRANLWGSGPADTVSVYEFPDGVSVGGVHQLIGNVWEWTAANYRSSDHPSGDVVLPLPMKAVRGGAFDTYFDNQATCQFASGENPLARKHNIGFRLAVSLCDLALSAMPIEEEAAV